MPFLGIFLLFFSANTAAALYHSQTAYFAFPVSVKINSQAGYIGMKCRFWLRIDFNKGRKGT